MRKKTLITGCSGFLGNHLFLKMQCLSFPVMSLGRTKPKNVSSSDHIYSNLSANSEFIDALKDTSTIIHCAARVHVMNNTLSDSLEVYREVNVAGTLNLAKQAINAGVRRFIFISSIKVNGESTPVNKPFRFDDERSPEDPYGQSKSEAEEQLLQLAKETGLEVVIIRPTLVYGPGVKANFSALMNLVSKGVPLPFGCITDNKRSLVSVDNLVDLIITCIDHPKAINEVFLVSDGYDVSTSEMVRKMAVVLNKPQIQIPIPKYCYRLAGKVFGKEDVVHRLLDSLQVDISHTKKTLDWTPPQSIDDGFRNAANAFMENKLKG
ncbi:UDP-glucose 4-epimerase family protein [Photobacterium leiognathi]|uniref:UDP-glucose 4-epimerase family protein n=1 Tax=Photobacterium leiognathi TaxID=553611 RepID=UPI00298143F7|nr:SDR family oxidoreductase [Photobacterium leiognathi]